MMQRKTAWGAALTAVAASLLLSARTAARAEISGDYAEISGDYIEARSASVYAGACHFNGELTTAGREAVLAWNIKSGSVDGVSVKDCRVVAVIAGDGNLADAKTARRSVLYLDSKASAEQRRVLIERLKTALRDTLGTVAAIKVTPVTFTSAADSIRVTAGDAAHIQAKPYPCDHCRMPAQVWYTPFATLPQNAKVAEGTDTGFSEKMLNVSWRQEPSDNVFVGAFTL